MISVDSVYKTVLYILNKEQRGYVTPAEFNSIGTLEQNRIFGTYFKLGAVEATNDQVNGRSNEPFLDLSMHLHHKLAKLSSFGETWFENTLNPHNNYPYEDDIRFFESSNFREIWRIGQVAPRYNSTTGGRAIVSDAQFLTLQDYERIKRSKLTAPDKRNPVFILVSTTDLNNSTEELGDGLKIGVSPAPDSIKAQVLFRPIAPKWAYTIGGQGQYIYDSTNSQDFELDKDETVELITGILMQFGVVIRDPQMIQIAMQQEQTRIN